MSIEHLAELRQLIEALRQGGLGEPDPLPVLTPDAEDRVPDPGTVLALGKEPLPDEARLLPPLGPATLRLVEEVLDLAEPVALRIGGTELRTSARRLTAKVVTLDPSFLVDLPPRRAAASLVWAVGQINMCFRILSDDTAERLGPLGEDKAYRSDGTLLLRVLGWEDDSDAWYWLLHPELTTSTTREELFEQEWEDDWDEDGEGAWDEWEVDWDLDEDDVDPPEPPACTCMQEE